MLKKMMLLAMAVAAVAAFTAPAMAQAATASDSEGPVEAGASLLATSTNTVTTIGGGVSLFCTHVVLSGEATGTGEELVGVEGGGEATGCTVEPFHAPATITSIEFGTNIENEEATFEFTFDALGNIGCSVGGTVGADWTVGTDVIDVAGGPLAGGGPAGCPAAAEKIEGTFTVTTENGAPVTRTS